MEKEKQRATSLDALREVSELLSPYVDSLKALIESTVDGIEQTEKGERQDAMAMIADRISRLISIVTLVHRECESSERDFEDLKSVEIHLLSVLKAIQTAERAHDLPMLSDLLEYELQDNLTQWKIKAIPQIKRRILASAQV